MDPIGLPCYPPDKFGGEYVYNDATQTYGALLCWMMPEEETPLHFNLIRRDPSSFDTDEIEVPGNATSYFDEVEAGYYMYQLTAVYEDCVSDFALTPEGMHFVSVHVTGVEENTNDEIVSILKIFNANGQSIATKNLKELGTGLYILQGLTQDGKLVSKKIVVNK